MSPTQRLVLVWRLVFVWRGQTIGYDGFHVSPGHCPSNLMSSRNLPAKMINDPSLSRAEQLRVMRGLARFNRLMSLPDAMYSHLRRYARDTSGRSLNVLDVASGSGDMPIGWAKRAQSDGIKMQITMLDIHSLAIEEQQRRAKEAGVHLVSLQQDCLHQALPNGFDVVTCTRFVHRLDHHQSFRLLQSMQQATDHAMLVCDFERSRLNLAMVSLAGQMVSRSKVVHSDLASSVRSAFTIEEFERLAEDALTRPVRVQRLFPFRFLASFDGQGIPEIVPAFA